MIERRSAMRVILPLLLVACARAEGEPRVPNRSGPPLVVELFTSQGCSSCPPADRLLSKLAADGGLGDRAVAPLAFHVDYWNDLGWSDPFSSADWTRRQNDYARALHDDRVYTPELVVGGTAGMVGSNLAAVTSAIQNAPQPAALNATATWTGQAVTVAATAPADADVWVAVWEADTQTKVTRGENSGETLGGDRVVRRLARVATAGHQATSVIPLDAAWRAGGAVAFAQRADRRITASALLMR
jgi:hypothetical protein